MLGPPQPINLKLLRFFDKNENLVCQKFRKLNLIQWKLKYGHNVNQID